MSVWPLFELTIQTPRIVLRYPTDDLLPGLTAAAAAGIHPPEDMPFSIPWTRKPPGEFERGICQFVWSRRATHTVDNWGLPFIVVEKGTPIGIQERSATNYPTVRTVETGSWLTNRAQGRGIGKEMRAAVLHLAFAGLGATAAIRASFVDNPKSEAVSRALGYHPNGSTIIDREHQPVRMNRWTLPRETWEANRRDDIDITGLDACLRCSTEPAQTDSNESEPMRETAHTPGEVMQAMVTAFDTGEVSDIAAVVHSTYLDHQGLPGQQPVTGTDGFVQVVETARRGFTQLSVTIEDMIENGDRVAARLRWNGVTTSGERAQRETIDIIVVRGGQAIEHWGARS